MDTSRQRTGFRAAVCLTAASIVLFAVWSVRPATGELSYGFASYYTAARLVRDGFDAERLYDNNWFLERSIELGFVDTPDIYFVNPPPTSLILLPLSELSIERADLVWTLLNALLLVAAVGVIFKTLQAAGLALDWRTPLPWALVALIAIYNPIWQNVYYGQMYILLLLLASLAMRAYVFDQQRRLGLWLGLMFAAKSAGVLLWGVLLLGRRFRALAWGVGTLLAVVLAASPLLGLSVWWTYVEHLPGLFNQPWSGVTAYQTTTSLIHHNLHVEPRSNGSPIVDMPSLVQPLVTTTNVVLFGLAALAGWVFMRELEDRRRRLARFGLLSGLLIPLQPLGEEHHYTLALPAVLAALLLALDESAGTRRALMLLLATTGTLLLAIPLNHTDPGLQPGFRALLAYPKLYGGLLIAGAMATYLLLAPAYWRATAHQHAGRLRCAIRPSSSVRRSASAPRLPDQPPRP